MKNAWVNNLLLIEGGFILASSYLVFWHFGIQMYFITSIWWHNLNPTSLSIDYMGLALLFCAAFFFPLMYEIPFVFRFLMKGWWAVYGIVPAVAISLTLIPVTRLRTIACALAVACGLVGTAHSFTTSAASRFSRSTPWAMSLGVLFMQVVKYSWGSVNPFLDHHYHDKYGFVAFKLTGCLLAILASLVVRRHDACKDVDGGGEESNPDVEEGRCCQRGCLKDRRTWLWTAVAPILAAFFTTNHIILSNPGTLVKSVGLDPFPSGVAVPFCLAIGVPVSYILARYGVALPICSFIMYSLGVALKVGDTECTELSSCGGFQTIAGGLLMAFAQPTLGLVVFTQMTRLARPHSGQMNDGAAGRTFAFAGLFVCIHVVTYISMIMNSPVPGMNGRYGLWFNGFVSAPALLGLLVVIGLHFKDSGLTAAFAKTEAERLLDMPETTGMGPSPKVGLFMLLAFMLLFMPTTIGLRISQQAVTTSPTTGNINQIKVMAFNNMQGFTTKGDWNGDCFADVIRRSKPDHVAIPEGESMRLYTGSRDPVDFAQMSLRMYADFGPPSWVGGAGIAVLSAQPFHRESWEMLPKESDMLNRFFIHSEYTIGSVLVHVLSIHVEWFGDPSMQIAAIAKKARSLKGPVIILGDFNLEPSGANNNAVNATGFDSLTDAGFRSVTPLTCDNTMEKPKAHQCRSQFPNVVADTMCYGLEDCDGYQLDYIFYTPYFLKVVPGTEKIVTSKLRGDAYCSDHQPIEAIFTLTEAALNSSFAKQP